MGVMTVGDQVVVTVVGDYLGQVTMNTYPFIVSSVLVGTTQADAFSALNISLDAAGSLFSRQRGCAPQNWTLVEAWIQTIRPTRYRKFIFANGGIGTFVDQDGLTANLQASIERYADVTGKHDQGAVRIPIGTDPTSILNGSVTPALKTALLALATQMELNQVTGGCTFLPITGVVSSNWAPLRVIGTSVKNTVRVIRRRTVGLGI